MWMFKELQFEKSSRLTAHELIGGIFDLEF